MSKRTVFTHNNGATPNIPLSGSVDTDVISVDDIMVRQSIIELTNIQNIDADVTPTVTVLGASEETGQYYPYEPSFFENIAVENGINKGILNESGFICRFIKLRIDSQGTLNGTFNAALWNR